MRNQKKNWSYPFFVALLFLLNACQNKDSCQFNDAVFENLPSPVEEGWIIEEGDDIVETNTEHQIAKFELKTGGIAYFVNLSENENAPSIGLITIKPHISRGQSPQNTLRSPLEIFQSLKEDGNNTPALFERHHRSLAALGRFPTQPRNFQSPPWSGGSSDLPPEYGPVDLCADGGFAANWAWFSMGHGVNNQHTEVPFELWTGWSVLTGTSEARSVAICLPHQENVNGANPQARYIISNKEGNGPWVNIFDSGWLSRGEGIGFQTYGPGNGRTRIRVITQNDDHYYFWAGASWGNPSDWISPN